MNRLGRNLWLALGLVAVTSGPAFGAAEVHRLNLVISGIPTQLAAGDYNDRIDHFNRLYLSPGGLESLDRIRQAWLFDAHLRYFVRPNIAVVGGVGQLRKKVSREFLPAVNFGIQLRSEILSVPVHMGGAYYFRPYNQGDFRAQAYLGAGFISSVYNRVRMQQVTAAPDTFFYFQSSGRGDAPGYYTEAGAHLFFATRFSVMLGVMYRDVRVRELQGRLRQGDDVIFSAPLSQFDESIPLGGLKELDLSGVGARLALAIGF